MDLPSVFEITYYFTVEGSEMSDDKTKRESRRFENRRLIFKNFAGVQTKFNEEGDRNFNFFLTPEEGETMKAEGWNVKYPEVRDPDDDPKPHIQVTVKYNMYPPVVHLITGKNMTTLSEKDLEMLDWAEITNADIVIRPYTWEVNGNSGIKAYLKSLFVTIEEDPFAAKYAALGIAAHDKGVGIEAASDEVALVE
jgi:hypothetical protein